MIDDRVSRNSERLMSLSLGVQAIGTMLFTLDDNCGFSDETRAGIGYLLTELGEIMKKYYIRSERGWWLPQGMGYTQNKSEAGIFTHQDMEQFNLNGCTLFDID